MKPTVPEVDARGDEESPRAIDLSTQVRQEEPAGRPFSPGGRGVRGLRDPTRRSGQPAEYPIVPKRPSDSVPRRIRAATRLETRSLGGWARSCPELSMDVQGCPDSKTIFSPQLPAAQSLGDLVLQFVTPGNDDFRGIGKTVNRKIGRISD